MEGKQETGRLEPSQYLGRIDTSQSSILYCFLNITK